MTRASRSRPSLRMPAVRRQTPPYRLRVPELLEDRTVPAVTIEPAGANQFVVRFTEDLPGAADTVLLRVNNGGRLEHSTNGAAFTADLNSAVAGVQPLALTAILRIDVSLGGGDDVLGVDGLADPAVIPIPPGGIVFAAGPGTDRLDLSHGQNMVLTATAQTVAGRTVTFTDLDAARLTGGSGDSVLDASGFGGPVTLDGGNGKDTLIGGSGNDVLLGVAGADSMDGRGGNDQLFSGNSGTTMIGGAGNDTLNGGNGPDQASGGDGDDALFGGNGGDALDGGAGNDVFYGGLGNDTALGGDGADRVVGAGDINWTLTDTSLTGGGTDILISVEEGVLVGGVGPNALNASGFSGFVTLQGGGGNDILTGGTGHNVFNRPPGELGSVTMIGGPAGSINDYFLLPQGTTFLVSPGGHDRLNFGTAVSLDLTNANGSLQVVDAAGSVIALTGHFEDFLGSGGDDTVIAESNTVITPGIGKDTVVVNGKTNVVINGGADADILQQTDGINIILSGDDGLDTLVSTRGTGVTLSGGRDADSLQTIDGINIILNGGADADSLQTVDGTNIVLSGDDGLDTLTSTRGTGVTLSGGRDADSLQSIDGTNIILNGDDGLDTLTSTRGTGVTLSGGRDADSLQSIDGSNIILNGDDGLDTLTSTRGTGVTLSGGRDADTLQSVDGTNIILNGGADADTLQSFDGTTIILNGDDGLDTLTSTRGTGVTLSGGRDADSLQSIDGSNIILNGDDGLDTLTSTRGTGVTLSGGRDADTLQSIDGTNIVLSGDDGLDTLTSTRGTGVTLSGGRDADSLQTIEGTTIILNGDDGLDTLISTRATGVTLSGGRDADTLISEAGTQIVMSGDEGNDRLVVSGATLDTINGGPGNDTIVLAGASLGTVVITETAGPAPDTSLDTLDFSGFTGGPINLNLGLTGLQTVTPGTLVLDLQDAAGIENVIGTAGADTVTGNGRDNLLLGADPLNPLAGPAPAWDGVTQVVFLDFGTHTDVGEHVYDAAERTAIQARIAGDYAGLDPSNPWFHFQFVQTRPASYPYAEVQFNKAPPDGGTGGFAEELDFRNTNLGTAENPSIATVQVNGILGAENQPPESFDNWVALSAKIAAHELGHLVGLLHQDSFGPIGYGPHAPPGGAAYNPDYPGPSAGFETFNHLMSSPASVGSNRTNDLRDLYFGEREAVKLTVSESGTVLAESGLPHRTFATAQPLTLATLAVPNTLGAGLNAPKAFSVAALVVTGAIGLETPAGVSESDFYSFAGKKGDVVNIEVLSTALSRLGDNTIDAMIRVYDASNTLVAYFETPAVNDDQFEAIDAVIMDLVLPADGTFYLEVDTFSRAGEPDDDTGAYELLVYRFDAGNANDAGDVLNGQGGNDTAAGGLGDDVYVISAAGADAVVDPSGRDTLDFSATPAGVTVNLALDAGQTQTVTALGGTLAVTGTIELAFGSAFADSITGNAADNRLFGGAGNDTMAGGLGNDVVIGGAGNDTLDGDDGRDLLVGGLGIDVLRGLGGDDVLIGGQTTYDANVSALDALMAEWTGTGTYAQRVARLTGTPGGVNGTTYLIKGTTVLDDAGAGDTLTGGLGLDLFFGFTKDKVMDREAPTETVL